MPKPEIECESCGSTHVAEYQYGRPIQSEDLRSKLDSGKVILGSCMVSPDAPRWHCHDCHNNWCEVPDADFMRKMDKDQEIEDQRKLKIADERGVLDARANKHGAVKCPFCNWTFPANYTNEFWDGERHLPCKTRLNIINE